MERVEVQRLEMEEWGCGEIRNGESRDVVCCGLRWVRFAFVLRSSGPHCQRCRGDLERFHALVFGDPGLHLHWNGCFQRFVQVQVMFGCWKSHETLCFLA